MYQKVIEIKKLSTCFKDLHSIFCCHKAYNIRSIFPMYFMTTNMVYDASKIVFDFLPNVSFELTFWTFWTFQR